MHAESGLTLGELLVALLVVSILAALAVPGLGALRREAALTAAAQQMVAALSLARSAAAARGVPVAVCLSAEGAACLTAAGAVAERWLVFVNPDGDQPVRRDVGEALLRSYALHPPLRLHATRAGVNYWPAPRAGSTTTFTICDPRAAEKSRAVIVSQSGRVRVAAGGAPSGERAAC